MAAHEETAGVEAQPVSLSLLRSVLPDDHVNRSILTECERLELVIINQMKSYVEKVEVLMSVLGSLLTDCLIRVSPATTAMVFEYLLKHTLLLILHGDWGTDKAIVNHMEYLLRRFRVRAEKKKLVRVVRRIEYLLHLVRKNPWGNVALAKIIGNERETEDELLEFVQNEIDIFLSVRLEILVYARCEMVAMTLIEKCLDCICSPVNREYFLSFTNEITRLKDLYLLILNKAKNSEYSRGLLLNEVKKRGSEECLKFVERCRSGKLPFEVLSKKSADVVASMALASALVKEDTDERILQGMIQLWFDTFTDNQVLFRLLTHMVVNAKCSRYIYSFGEKLIDRVKLAEKELCVEIFVRGLTLNINEIEGYKTTEDQVKVKELKVQLSKGFLRLGEYLKDALLYPECVLTAFSLDPSQSCFEKIKVLGEKNGKLVIERKTKGIENDPSLNKHGESTLPESGQNQAVMMGQCDVDLPPVSGTDIGQMDPNEIKEGSQFCEKPLPLTVSLVQDTVCHNRTVKSHSGQTKDKERILDEYQSNGVERSEEITHCGLSQQVSNLSLEDDANSAGDHDKENNPENTNTSCSKSRPLQRFQVYDAERIGISETLCDDLSTLVDNVKNQELTFDLDRSELIRRCETYVMKVECNKIANKDDFNTAVAEESEPCLGVTECVPDHICPRVDTPTRSRRKRKYVCSCCE